MRADGGDDPPPRARKDEEGVAARRRAPARAVLDRDLARERLRAAEFGEFGDGEPVARRADLARARAQEAEGRRGDRAEDGGEDGCGNPEEYSSA